MKRLHLAGLDSFVLSALSVLVFVCGASSQKVEMSLLRFLPFRNQIDTAGVSGSHSLMALVLSRILLLLHPDQGPESLDDERLAFCEDDMQPDAENETTSDPFGVIPLQKAEVGVQEERILSGTGGLLRNVVTAIEANAPQSMPGLSSSPIDHTIS